MKTSRFQGEGNRVLGQWPPAAVVSVPWACQRPRKSLVDLYQRPRYLGMEG